MVTTKLGNSHVQLYLHKLVIASPVNILHLTLGTSHDKINKSKH